MNIFLRRKIQEGLARTTFVFALTVGLFGALAGCSEPQKQNVGVYMLLDTSGTYTDEIGKAQQIILGQVVLSQHLSGTRSASDFKRIRGDAHPTVAPQQVIDHDLGGLFVLAHADQQVDQRLDRHRAVFLDIDRIELGAEMSQGGFTVAIGQGREVVLVVLVHRLKRWMSGIVKIAG